MEGLVSGFWCSSSILQRVLAFLSYGWDWVPLEDSRRVLSFAEPLRCRTPPLPPMPPPSARSPHSHLSPPPSERLEFWRVGVPWGRLLFSSGKGSTEQNVKVTPEEYMLHSYSSKHLESSFVENKKRSHPFFYLFTKHANMTDQRHLYLQFFSLLEIFFYLGILSNLGVSDH